MIESSLANAELNEDIFRQFADYAEFVFWVCEPDVSKFHYISPGYEKVWGQSREHLYVDPKSFLEFVHPDDVEAVIAAAFGANSCHADQEHRIMKSNGTVCWLRNITFPIYDQQGNIFRMGGIAWDVSVRKQAELEMLKTLQRQRELNEAKTNLITIISHQIRTPLAKIQSSSDMLEYYPERLTDDKKRLYFQQIKTAIKEISHIVQDVLTLSEANAKTLGFEPISIDIVQLCKHIIDNIQSKNQIILTTSVPSLQALFDPKLIQYIINNLLENALKYSPADSEIKLNLNLHNQRLVIEIKDQGIGIRPENIPHIFDSFYRADNVGTVYGTGLGLAIVKQCVELHSDEILVSSVVDKGTIFTVILPIGS